MNAQLLERDAQNTEIRTQLDDIHAHYDKLTKEKAQVLAENSALVTYVFVQMFEFLYVTVFFYVQFILS